MPTAKKAKKTPAKKISKKPLHRELSVKLTKDNESFWSLKPTAQTFYWLIIGIAVIGTVVINYDTNMRVNALIDQLNDQQAALDSSPLPPKKPH